MELRAKGAACRVVPGDLAEPDGAAKLHAAVGGAEVDVLVNNAGFGDLGPFADADLAKMLRMIRVNVTALTELTGLFLPAMVKRGRGRVLNVGSVAGFQPGPLMAVYYATKAFVNSFSQALSNELAGTGVTATCLCPGPTATEFAGVAGMQSTKTFTVGGVVGAGDVAVAGVRGMTRGKVLVVPGFRNRLLIFLERFAPRGVVMRAVRWMQEKRRS